MEIIKYTQLDKNQWNNHLSCFEMATFNYTSNRIDFDCRYTKQLIENESFIIVHENQVVGMVIVIVEQLQQGLKSISSNDSYLFGPIIRQNLSLKSQEKWMKVIFKEISSIAEKYNCQMIKYQVDPLSNPNGTYKIWNFNPFVLMGYNDYSIGSRIIDLTLPYEILKQDFRSSYKSEINKALTTYQFKIWDDTNISQNEIHQFVEIYDKAAGFRARSMEYVDCYDQWIKDKQAWLIMGYTDEKAIAAILVTLYNDKAYYAFSAELPDEPMLNKVPIGHGMQVTLMKAFIQKNIKYYELGWQYFSQLPYDTSTAKEKNICFFKTGFGGYTVPLFRGIQKCTY